MRGLVHGPTGRPIERAACLQEDRPEEDRPEEDFPEWKRPEEGCRSLSSGFVRSLAI
jgi:hypothetical protein